MHTFPKKLFVELFSLGTVQFVYRMFWEKNFHCTTANRYMPKFLTPSTNLPTFRLVTVTTFLREKKPSKISSQSPRSNQESSDRFYCFCLINLWYNVQKTFSCLPTTKNLNLCQKNSSGLLREKNEFSSFHRNEGKQENVFCTSYHKLIKQKQ